MSPKLKLRKAPPHEFVLEALAAADYHTKPMFGCLSVYLGERIVLILRDREEHRDDNGVWLATDHEHHESLRRELPSMREIRLFSEGGHPTSWQNLPAESPDFEEEVLRACELVLHGDPRIGKVPKSRKTKPRSRPGTRRRR
jgi:hypothetical protein